MFEDKLAFFTSTRFWQYALAIVIFVLLDNGVVSSANVETVLQIVASLSAIAATVGTVDRFGEMIGG